VPRTVRRASSSIDLCVEFIGGSDGAQYTRSALSEWLGRVVAGRYRVVRALGRGGRVFEALDEQHDRRVALRWLTSGEDAVYRALPPCPNLVPEIEPRVADQGARFSVSQWVDAVDLEAWVQGRGPLSLQEAINHIIGVCEALSLLHGQGLLHGRLALDKLMRCENSEGGVAVLLCSPLPLTVEHAIPKDVLPLIRHAPPEYAWQSHSAQPSADVWAIGVMLYELLSGQAPWGQGSDLSVGVKPGTDPVQLQRVMPAAPMILDQLVEGCLAYKASERVGSVQRVVEVLRQANSFPPVAAPRLGSSTLVVDAGAMPLPPQPPQTPRVVVSAAPAVRALGEGVEPAPATKDLGRQQHVEAQSNAVTGPPTRRTKKRADEPPETKDLGRKASPDSGGLRVPTWAWVLVTLIALAYAIVTFSGLD